MRDKCCGNCRFWNCRIGEWIGECDIVSAAGGDVQMIVREHRDTLPFTPIEHTLVITLATAPGFRCRSWGEREGISQ